MNEVIEAQEVSRLKPLRTWPALILLLLMLVLRFLPSLLEDGPAMIWMSSAFGPLLCSLVVLVWWIAFSRASLTERAFGFFGLILLIAATVLAVDSTMRGPATMMLTIPMGIACFVAATGVLGRMLSMKRTVAALAVAALGLSFSTLLKSDGVWGNFDLGLSWRWKPTSEQKLLADEANRSTLDIGKLSAEEVQAGLAAPQWPGFRGPNRDGIQRGTAWSANWQANQPEELWRITVGPGWSSFAVAGQLCYTQEQRGDVEVVACYDMGTGAEIWTHEVTGRFDDPLGGPGPRATPTVSSGQLFAMGATGELQRLDPLTGEQVWGVDLKDVAKRPPPMWGFSSSPLVTGQAVIVHAAGKDELGIIAFDRENGQVLWSAPTGEMSYSSPQLSRILGQDYLLMLTDKGLDLLDPASGELVFQHAWESQGYRALQPQVIGDDRVLLPTGLGHGTRCIRISRSEEGSLSATELWTSRDLKPDYNDLVIYENHIYGFDSKIFTCIDLETGNRAWKGGRYDKGQVILLEDPGLLVVVTEQGKLVLVKASPESHQELATIDAMSSKTWNHPVVVGDRLLVRNSEEAICYRLPLDATPEAVESPAEQD